jgi:fermentation-respiration switch protein FrsA (DUF1100 family)
VRALVLLFLVIGAVYLVLLLFLYFNQARLIYFPESRIFATPDRVGLPFENVLIKGGDDTLHGWFVPADSGAPVVLFCHGNAGNIGDRLEYLEHIHAAGLAVFIFDYSGFGQSTGRPGEAQTYRDAEAAYGWLSNRGYADSSIIAYGRSLGGAVAAYVSRGKKLRAVVLENAFPSLVAVAQIHYPWIPVGLIVRHRYPTLDYLKDVRSLLFIVHNRNDEIVPFALGKQLFDDAPEPKIFVIEEGSHNSVAPIDWRRIAFPAVP